MMLSEWPQLYCGFASSQPNFQAPGRDAPVGAPVSAGLTERQT